MYILYYIIYIYYTDQVEKFSYCWLKVIFSASINHVAIFTYILSIMNATDA